MRKRLRNTIILVNALIVLLSLTSFAYGSMDALKNALFNFDMKASMSGIPNENIIVVGIDEASLQALGTYPWDRKVYVDLLAKMNQTGSEAKAIGFDILFTTNGDASSDAEFAKALAKYHNVVLPCYAETESFFRRQIAHFDASRVLTAEHWNKPIPELDQVTRHAHINALYDNDGVIRKSLLQINEPDGTPVYSLGYMLAEMAGAKAKPFLNDNPQTQITIKYEASANDFETVSFSRVLDGEFPAENFKDRIVLIGFTAVGFGNDNGITPIDKEMKLVYVHANIVNQLLNGERVLTVANLYVSLLILLILLLGMLLSWRLKTLVSLFLLLGVIGLLLVGQFAWFAYGNSFLDVVHPTFSLLLSFLSNVAVRTYYETKQKNFITKQFGRYLSPELVGQIAKSDRELPLGGVNKELSILFLDIRGFTTLSEKLKPEEVVGFLNMMFDMITNKALANQGTIDKFIGDAAMIIFNAPLVVEQHPYFAVKTAYDIQQGMAEVRQEIMDKYGVEISIGIGINTGEVVVGNIGSFLRVDYTAIGDHVNTAARIEANTAANQILVSEATYERTKAYFSYIFAGEKRMKGKTVEIKLYEVDGFIQSPSLLQKKKG